MSAKEGFSSSRTPDWCPICSTGFASTPKLGAHMKACHQRLILQKDISTAKEARDARRREYDPDLD